MAQLIKANTVFPRRPLNFDPANGVYFTLEELQKGVGGYIEALYLHDGRVMFVNEDGKRLELPPNPLADMMAHQQTRIAENDHIVGDVIICTRAEAGGPI